MNPQRDGRLGVGVIGSGRVGPVLAQALAGAGHAIVGISAVSEQSRERAETLVPGVLILDVPQIVERSELVLLAVPDDQLPGLVSGLAEAGVWQSGQIVVHTAPSHGVGILSPATAMGALPIAIHPVMAFSGTSVDLLRLHETYFAVTCPVPLLPIGQALVVEMGGEPFVVAEEDRPQFGVAVDLATKFPRDVVRRAVEGIGHHLDISGGQILAPLLRTSLENEIRNADSITPK